MSLTIHKSGNSNHPPILFLHGLGVSSWMWHDQINALSDSYYCLAIDLPGNGESYQHPWRSFTDTANQLADIIRAESSTQKAHVVGLSLGGYTALYLLATHPDVVDKTIISGVSTQPLSRQRLLKTIIPVMGRIMGWTLMIKLNARLMQIPDEVFPLYQRDSKRVSLDTWNRVYDEVLPFTLPASLGDCQHDVLAAAGEKEAKAILTGLPDIPATLPNGTAVIAPNAHHGWNGEFPELFTDMIRAWLENRSLPDALIPITQKNPEWTLA